MVANFIYMLRCINSKIKSGIVYDGCSMMHYIAQVTFFLNGGRLLPGFSDASGGFRLLKYNMLVQCNHVLSGNKTNQQ